MNIQKVVTSMTELIRDGLGFDLNDPNLKDTPQRVAKMYCNEFFSGVGKEFSDFKSFPNDHKYDQIVASDKIHFTSMCAHHFLPFSGYAWVLYIPDKWLIGASKMARLVNHYSHKPQIQENLVHEIISAFDIAIKPLGVMVYMRATHDCMSCRGVKQNEAAMSTSAVRGAFAKNLDMETKGLEMIKISLGI
jgi:GTP cyclohydrolase IA